MSDNKQRPHFMINEDIINKRPTDFDGGGSTHRRNDYSSHGRYLINNLNNIQETEVYDEDLIKDRYFFEIHLAEDEKIKDKYNNLKDNSRVEILDVINDSVGYGMIKKQDMEILLDRILEYSNSRDHKGKSYFSFIEEYRNINYKDKISSKLREMLTDEENNEKVKVIIESFSSLPRDIQEKGFVEKVQEFVNGQKGQVFSSYIHSSGSVVVETEISPSNIKFLAENFQSIRFIEPISNIKLTQVKDKTTFLENIKVENLEGGATVCIFDSGVNMENALLSPYITDNVHEVVAQDYDTGHGTFVASRAVYRDTLQEQVTVGTLTPKVRVLDVRIYGMDGTGAEISLTETELIIAIRKTVQKFHREVKVYNLSLGFLNKDTDETALSDVQVSRIAAEIDFLSKKYGVLFVISAGNIKSNFLYRYLNAHGYPNYFSYDDATRITPPSEAFTALSVGAVVTKYGEGALTPINHPSPFSRRGPGFGGTRKPDLVADGGNIMANGEDNNEIQTSALGGPRNSLVYDSGTSFAAPIISSYAAELFDAFPDISNNLVKGMLIHFANIPYEANNYPRDKFEHMGFGITNFNMCIESLKSRVTYVHEGILEQQTYYRIPFWIPSALTDSGRVRRGRKKLKLRATIIWDPLVDRRKQSGYSLVHINSNIFKINDQGEEGKIPLGASTLDGESYKEKFYPVTRLEKMFERNIQSGLWNLELRMSHRWGVPEGYEQDFAVLISVEDPYDEIDVYNEITNEVGVRFSNMVQF
ncbi:hypothetical protein GCM10011351_20660 [Paraliobacillus quinghaiensis]|uniref:Peptidase S8/S53 domain-containing protein n=1 Tax=Paraliobacillus quinghaiensis TaxID=470815 RepID=A0A917TRC9_9BACI|nr:S8 family peptidase [Paraliobacillus quinghaiensis]GGM34556.1 hypothetical protein GCM10011351_20660 [Paraliobacillus quinghaiensis]